MKFLFETLILVVVAVLSVYLYQNYWDDLQYALFGDRDVHTIYLGATALEVSVADEHSERVQGLSGVKELDNFEAKLFIFDNDGKHAIWMKDMLFPLDILWINKDLGIIHIEENVLPETYPNQVFAPPVDARFVLELNAYYVRSIGVELGERITLPPSLIPDDIKRNLQQ